MHQYISIANFIFIPKCALDKMKESTKFNVCKSSSFTNHEFLLELLFKGDTYIRSLFYHYHKKRISWNFTSSLYFLRLIFGASENLVKVS